MSTFEKWCVACGLAFLCFMAAAGWGILGYIVYKNATEPSPQTVAPDTTRRQP